MAYRNGTYVAFHAGGTTNPIASDIKYYNLMLGWTANRNIEFSLINSHEKTSSVRDSSAKDTLRRSLITRLNNSKHMILILTQETKSDTDWVPFEISYAIDNCNIPIIATYPNYTSILSPRDLAPFWPSALSSRITRGEARVIHIPFKQAPILDAISQFGVNNTAYPTDGYGFYSREAHINMGLL
ncbi:MAG: TIR domain-containing protein [Flavobacteriales bacterium]|nr:TIR domain-containing protein [Flavobacteriales bacterium]